jgi:hypothetical protein
LHDGRTGGSLANSATAEEHGPSCDQGFLCASLELMAMTNADPASRTPGFAGLGRIRDKSASAVRVGVERVLGFLLENPG